MFTRLIWLLFGWGCQTLIDEENMQEEGVGIKTGFSCLFGVPGPEKVQLQGLGLGYAACLELVQSCKCRILTS